MRNLVLLMGMLIALVSACSNEKHKTETHSDSNGYRYESVTNDPAGLRIYTLNNGLKVYLSNNPLEPRIMGFVGVNAGSTSDPEATTGLAHYFEHIMFKGTSSFGTTNWEKEKPLLDSISALFEIYREEKDDAKRKTIYEKIDKLSLEASGYAIANEYDKMVSEMGAKYTNAFTSYEMTAYMNDIPSNELKRWLEIEYNRFGDVALRLFHTELETVYEEFNMYQDRDGSRAWNAMQKALFPKNPLGRDVIGEPEHLKNPSMVNIMNFKETWYVPNNMVICLSGEFDMEETIKAIDDTFGQMTSKPLPERARIVEDPITSPIEIEITGPDAENLMMAWRLDSQLPEDRQLLYLASNILYNRTAGLIDINLLQDQQVLDASAYPNFFRDYGAITISVTPKNDQSLEEARDLILQEIEKLKAGDFPDWMPTAIANQRRLSLLRNFQGNWRAYAFLNAFIMGDKWSDVLSFADHIENKSKKQITGFANDFFGNNYVAVYKRTGEATGLVKVPKPPITPVLINRDDQSVFYTSWKNIPRDTMMPVFIDYKKALQTEQIREGINLSYMENKTNELFSQYYIIDAGKNHNLKAPIAFNYIPFVGTKNYTATELKQELFRLGLSTSVWCGQDRSWIYISGLNRNYEKGLELMEEMITQAVPDTTAFRKYAENTIKERNDAKLNLDNIMWEGLWNYAQYGAKSPFNDVLTNDEIRAIDPAELTGLVKNHFSYPHKAFYFGPSPLADVKQAITKYHSIPDELHPIPAEKKYPELDISKNQVFLANYDMSQVNVILLGKGKAFSKDIYVKSNLFNQYFGNSMSSIVFQEIREAQGMAYSAWVGYSSPAKKDNSFYLMGFIGTQPDKLEMATNSFVRLLTDMIEKEQSLNVSRNSILNTIATERITNTNVFFQYLNNTDLGIENDIREELYKAAQDATMEDLRNFFNTYIKDQPYAYLVLGDTRSLDKNVLKRMGEVKHITLEELFGY
jgi:zinc protease